MEQVEEKLMTPKKFSIAIEKAVKEGGGTYMDALLDYCEKYQLEPEMIKMVENEILLADSIDKEKMKKMAKMDKAMGHSHSNSVLLEPNQKGEIIWKFDNAVNIEVACNVPGHYQVGMIAKVDIN